MLIKKLSKETINLISAGEVIEGPSDVLKELLENSIDANASEVVVEIKNAGSDLICVKDNGTGILKDDLLVCLEKYATSKLRTIHDLENIQSYGFRGEALSTISAVSKLKIISASTQDGKGYVFENNVLTQIAATKGTTIKVKDLFYNVPVRKKFLKTKSVEFSKVYDIFLAFVLLNPDVSFKFISEKKNVFFPKTTQKQRVVQIYGKEISQKTLYIDIEHSVFKVNGFLTNPSNPIYFPTNFLFINKRCVYSPQIYKAVTDAYKDYLMIQQKPFFILYITLDQKTIDVNIHPKKRVVKLQNEMLFLMEFKKELSKIIDKHLGKEITSVSSHTLLNDYIKLNSSDLSAPAGKYISQAQPLKEKQTSFFQKTNYFHTQNHLFSKDFEVGIINLFEHKITKILGQVHHTFILCETKEGMIFIDQHAADERINLEKNRFLFSTIQKQKLIVPLMLETLSESQKDILKNNRGLVNDLGFGFEISKNEFLLTTVPLFLDKYFDKNILLNLLKDIEQGNNEIERLKDNLLKLKSCKQSIKANHFLEHHEQVNLIKKLAECDDKGICAHGRPTIIFLSLKDLEKLFKRIV